MFLVSSSRLHFQHWGKCPWTKGREFLNSSFAHPGTTNACRGRLHEDNKVTSCHVCYSSRGGGRMFDFWIYDSWTTLEKMTWDNLVLQPTLLQPVGVNCFECFRPPLPGGWDSHLPAFICQTTHSLCSLFLEIFKDLSNSEVFSCDLRYPLANFISCAYEQTLSTSTWG